MTSQPPSYHGYRFPPEIISHAVWLCHRFCLSFRDAEDLLAQRGVTVTYETIRQWCQTFGLDYARRLRRQRGRALLHEDPARGPHYGDAVECPSHVQDEVPRCELAGVQPGPRSTRRCDGVAGTGGGRCLDTPPARQAAAVLGSRHRDRLDSPADLPS